MRDEPAGADLLRAIREGLADEVAPALQGGQRYVALMVTSALKTVERELAFGNRRRATDVVAGDSVGLDRPEVEAEARGLCAAIRLGRHDGDERLHAVLYARAIDAVAVTRPDALTEAERRRGEHKPRIGEVLDGAEEGRRSGADALRLC